MTINIDKRLHEHALYVLDTYNKDWFVLCLQGSQNYGMADEESDVDSKMLILPTLEDLVLNNKPISHTLEMPDNQEHIDVKDAREYFKIFRKSNINFVEILFTDYWMVNHKYNDLWLELRRHREELARINPYAAVSCMGGMSAEKYHSLTHEYPSRMHIIKKYGYDPKQLSHLVRIKYFIEHYVQQDSYQNCIFIQDKNFKEYLIQLKRNGAGLSKKEALDYGEKTFNEINNIVQQYRKIYKNQNDKYLDSLLNDILYQLISRSIKEQIKL